MKTPRKTAAEREEINARCREHKRNPPEPEPWTYATLNDYPALQVPRVFIVAGHAVTYAPHVTEDGMTELHFTVGELRTGRCYEWCNALDDFDPVTERNTMPEQIAERAIREDADERQHEEQRKRQAQLQRAGERQRKSITQPPLL